MEIGTLKEKVAAAEAKVIKCGETIARHELQLAKKVAVLNKAGITLETMKDFKWNHESGRGTEHYAAICDVESKQEDIKGATRKLQDAERILADWKAKLELEIEKERFLNEQAPAIIIEFLNRWKEQARDWFIETHAHYLTIMAELKVAKEAAEERFYAENAGEVRIRNSWSSKKEAFVKADEAVKELRKKISYMGKAIVEMASYRKEEERLAWLEKTLEADRKAKMIDLIHRINGVVGTITDAQYLRIDAKGCINGIIIGEKGKAKIETIGAGGYYIQCFHYRTLIHKYKGEVVEAPAAPVVEETPIVEGQQEMELEIPASGGPATGGKLGQQMFMIF